MPHRCVLTPISGQEYLLIIRLVLAYNTKGRAVRKWNNYFINHHLPIAKTERPFIVGYRLRRG